MHMSLKPLAMSNEYSNVLLSTRIDKNVRKVGNTFTIVKNSMEPTPQGKDSKVSHWNNKQKQDFVIFVSYFRQAMTGQSFKQCNWSIFKGLAKLVKTRNAQQCRSHYLKMLKQYVSLEVFIKVALQRISNLSQKISQVQEQLIQIQKQFLLSEVTTSENQNHLKPQEMVDSYTNQSNLFGFSYFSQKREKNQLIKTAADYQSYQHPVKINHNNYSLFSSESEFKPFNNIKPKRSRASIQSFDDEQIKPQVAQQKFFNPIIPLRDELKHQIYMNNEIEKKNAQVQSYSSNKSMQNMKQLMQCHYLYQLWTSKLEKLIRDGNIIQSPDNNIWKQN